MYANVSFSCECEFIAYIKHRRLVMYEDPNEIHQLPSKKKAQEEEEGK